MTLYKYIRSYISYKYIRLRSSTSSKDIRMFFPDMDFSSLGFRDSLFASDQHRVRLRFTLRNQQ